MLERDSRGRIIGGTMDRETKRRISRAQKARHQTQRDMQGPLPSKKKCSNKSCDRAGQWLNVPDDFIMQNRRISGGKKRRYPSGECRQCQAKRRKKYRDDFIAEHGIEAWREREKAWNKNRNQEKKRKYNREYQRMKAAGTVANPRGPWKKYQHEVEVRLGRVPVEPFVEWWLALNGSRPTEAQMGPALARAVRRAVYGANDSAENIEDRKMDLEHVDQIGILTGFPHLIHVIYPYSPDSRVQSSRGPRSES